MRQVKRWLIIVSLGLALAGCGTTYQGLPIVVRSIIVPCPEIDYTDLAWSPDGSHIAFLAETQNNAGYVFVMNPDGADLRQLTNQPGHRVSLAWLPDSSGLSYFLDNYPQVLPLSPNGVEQPVPVPHVSTGPINDVALSPDGKRLAISAPLSPSEPTLEVYTVNLDGSDLKRLSNDPYADAGPLWSPDGNWIAYAHVEQNRPYIGVMRADGSDQKIVVPGTYYQWSPDSAWLGFISYPSTGAGIHVIRPDGTGERLVTTSMDTIFYSWLPDGSHISYAARLTIS